MRKEHKPRHLICNTLFLLKALVAIALGFCALGYNGFKVYKMYMDAKPVDRSVRIDPTKCLAPTGGLARLEPPNSTIMFGFSYDWIGDQPVSVSQKVGFNPAVS